MATLIRHRDTYTIHREPWRTLPDQTAETTGKIFLSDGSMKRFVAWMPANMETVTVALDDGSLRRCAWTLDDAIDLVMQEIPK